MRVRLYCMYYCTYTTATIIGSHTQRKREITMVEIAAQGGQEGQLTNHLLSASLAYAPIFLVCYGREFWGHLSWVSSTRQHTAPELPVRHLCFRLLPFDTRHCYLLTITIAFGDVHCSCWRISLTRTNRPIRVQLKMRVGKIQTSCCL